MSVGICGEALAILAAYRNWIFLTISKTQVQHALLNPAAKHRFRELNAKKLCVESVRYCVSKKQCSMCLCACVSQVFDCCRESCYTAAARVSRVFSVVAWTAEVNTNQRRERERRGSWYSSRNGKSDVTHITRCPQYIGKIYTCLMLVVATEWTSRRERDGYGSCNSVRTFRPVREAQRIYSA
jgi:hypothetical protein